MCLVMCFLQDALLIICKMQAQTFSTPPSHHMSGLYCGGLAFKQSPTNLQVNSCWPILTPTMDLWKADMADLWLFMVQQLLPLINHSVRQCSGLFSFSHFIRKELLWKLQFTTGLTDIIDMYCYQQHFSNFGEGHFKAPMANRTIQELEEKHGSVPSNLMSGLFCVNKKCSRNACQHVNSNNRIRVMYETKFACT